jgi:antitoxin MazE
MAKIVKIGNSQGIRIPKPLISLANLENKELDFIVLDSGLLITSKKKSRVGWQSNTDMTESKVIWEWWKN